MLFDRDCETNDEFWPSYSIIKYSVYIWIAAIRSARALHDGRNSIDALCGLVPA